MSGSLRRIVAFVATGCFMGALTVVATTAFVPARSAFASCSSHHANVEGYDAASWRYGNVADIYVNQSSTISGLNDGIFRSLFVNDGTWPTT